MYCLVKYMSVSIYTFFLYLFIFILVYFIVGGALLGMHSGITLRALFSHNFLEYGESFFIKGIESYLTLANTEPRKAL